jgi:hypothetical protein
MSGTLTLALLATTSASAMEPRVVCDLPNVEVQGAVSHVWAPTVDGVCQSLHALVDLDPAARATVWSAPSQVKVSVKLPDGRTAERRVATPAQLVPTLEALLVVPRLPLIAAVDAPIVPEALAEPVRHPLQKVDFSEAPVMRSTEAPPLAPTDANDTRLEIGADVGARFGRDVVLGPQLFANFHLAAWRLGAAVRWDAGALNHPAQGIDRRLPGTQPTQTVVGEIQLGRHFTLWQLGLDVGVSPRLGLVFPLHEVDFRGGAYARIGYRLGALNLFAVLDTEVSRATFSNLASPNSPIGFTGGLALGAAWFGL